MTTERQEMWQRASEEEHGRGNHFLGGFFGMLALPNENEREHACLDHSLGFSRNGRSCGGRWVAEAREITEQNLDLLIESLLATAPEWFVWQAPHADTNGASIHFGSGYELSIRWGESSYGSRRFQPNARRTTVEVALIDNKRGGKFVDLGSPDKTVLGWQDFGEVAALAQVIAEGELERKAA